MTPLASVIISTYNRADALPDTLEALARQTVSPDEYEVVVVDDGSTDTTAKVLHDTTVPYHLRLLRHAPNRGVSAGRNAGIRAAAAALLIILSDDLIVPETFVAAHIMAHERFENSWIVGGFKQLSETLETPFGLYLDDLERSFERARRTVELEPGVWKMAWPTARNLSLPAGDLDRIGLFDEQFRTTCEDQDLAQRAVARLGVQFLYVDAIECLHNDQAADLPRYCDFQRRGAIDTVRLIAKYPDVHGGAPTARGNGPARRTDGIALVLSKSTKRMLATRVGTRVADGLVRGLERARAPQRVLWRAYRARIAIAIFQGWREGLRVVYGRA